ncbi:MAG: hypothetical protein PHE95_00600 [Candidatus Methanomethylophilus sp.]|nr:hypothetical protein [Methanomethylophilus sp.]
MIADRTFGPVDGPGAGHVLERLFRDAAWHVDRRDTDRPEDLFHDLPDRFDLDRIAGSHCNAHAAGGPVAAVAPGHNRRGTDLEAVSGHYHGHYIDLQRRDTPGGPVPVDFLGTGNGLGRHYENADPVHLGPRAVNIVQYE